MKLQIEKTYVNALLTEFPGLIKLREQLRFGNKVEIPFNHLSNSELSYLQNLYQQAGSGKQNQAAMISTLKKAMNDDEQKYSSDDLELLVPDIAQYLINGAQKGWLFRVMASGKIMAYLITRLDYTPPGEEESGRILIELKANSRGKIAIENIILRRKDIEQQSISEILLMKGYLRETPELVAHYNESIELYFDWRARYGEQFSAKGTGIYAEDPTASHRSSDWTRKNVVVLSSSGGSTRVVNDENIISDRVLALDASGDILGGFLRRAGKSNRYDSKIEKQAEETKETIPKDLFTELPVHGYILMFHLELHHHVWVHVDELKPYQYQPELKDKLVLPPEQIDLIDILTAEMDVLMDDIVEGKSGGTTLLCAGPAGVGKTLTAEVYSEIIKRPLYRVHSGQLGLNVAEMEKALQETLIRAQRWGAVMLIDEADVYIRRRSDSLSSNAVVGVFLRVLEYFNGLLFLTTNRIDDIDEAIISRCIAMISYHPPHREDRMKIWQVMTKQFELNVEAQLIADLADIFSRATGREIKGLAKLAAKFCAQKQVQPSLDVFKRCSVFRGMDSKSN
ncbi:AAA family ATPase [Methyloprofundus sedimenti]|uniref:AAA family ATPase n=1 Tax=Methyloprofundus sedimenti TaxID=1420851 RepID=A0A1V8M228_9GAMM|nr:ATP-binding protein [Methyloprofundus sedimenti]OQK15611.1 AAA family ATPase [Methyloprofundus sedimenti]